MSQLNENQRRSIQNHLKLVLGITVVVSIILRLTAPGYLLFFLGIFLILGVVVHSSVHLYSIRHIDPLRPIQTYLISLSHLAFFLTFVFQVDGADGPRAGVPILFWMQLTWNSPWIAAANRIVSISALILLLSWALLVGISTPTQEKDSLLSHVSKCSPCRHVYGEVILLSDKPRVAGEVIFSRGS